MVCCGLATDVVWKLNMSGLQGSDERSRINYDLGQGICQHGICRDPGDGVDGCVDLEILQPFHMQSHRTFINLLG